MSVKRKTEDTRGMALWYITEYAEIRLGIPRNAFIDGLSLEDWAVKNTGKEREEKPGISEKTLWRYIRGETPMKRWTFKQFWCLVEKTCRNYMKEKGMNDAAKIWEQEKAKQEEMCRCYFLDLNAPRRSTDFPESAKRLYERGTQNKKILLDAIKPIFEALDERTAYSIQHNFSALASVTADDCVFMAHIMTRTKEEKEALKVAMLRGTTVDAGTMLAYLQSEDVRCWVNLKNRDYTDTARNSSGFWGRFKDKIAALMPWQYAAVSLLFETLLLLALDNGGYEEEKVEVKLPTADDIELLLLFKYCLDPEEREQFLESE